jgi:tetratricopeptide (TPR) repeat protein
VSDPWQPSESEKLHAALPRLRELAKKESKAWFLSTSLQAQKLAAYVAQVGESFRMADLVTLADLVGERSDQRREWMVFQQQDELIEELLRTRVLRSVEASEVAPSAELRFATKEVWGEAMKALLPQQSRQVHRALAEQLESRSENVDVPTPEFLSRIARHWEAAGADDRASQVWFEAGESAFSKGQNELAADALAAGWRTLSSVSRERAHGEAEIPNEPLLRSMPRETALHRLRLYANALCFCDRHEISDEWLDRMLILEPEGFDLAEYHGCKAELCQRQRRTSELLSHVEKGFLHSLGDAQLEGRLHFHKAQALIGDTNRIQQGIEAANKACQLLEAVQDQRYLSNAKAVLGVAHYHLGQIDLAKSAMEEGLEISRNAGFPFQEATAHTNLVAVASRSGKPAESMQHLRSALTLTERHGYRLLEMHCITNLSHLSYLNPRSPPDGSLPLSGLVPKLFGWKSRMFLCSNSYR